MQEARGWMSILPAPHGVSILPTPHRAALAMPQGCHSKRQMVAAMPTPSLASPRAPHTFGRAAVLAAAAHPPVTAAAAHAPVTWRQWIGSSVHPRHW